MFMLHAIVYFTKDICTLKLVIYNYGIVDF